LKITEKEIERRVQNGLGPMLSLAVNPVRISSKSIGFRKEQNRVKLKDMITLYRSITSYSDHETSHTSHETAVLSKETLF